MNKRRRYKIKRRRRVAQLLDAYYRPWRNATASLKAYRKLLDMWHWGKPLFAYRRRDA